MFFLIVYIMDNNIWFSNINLLFNQDSFNIIPSKHMNNADKINAITRFSFILSCPITSLNNISQM